MVRAHSVTDRNINSHVPELQIRPRVSRLVDRAAVGTELALSTGMPATRPSATRCIRLLRRALRGAILLPTAVGFLGGIIVSVVVVRLRSTAALLVAATSGLGATIAWWLRGAEDRRVQRAMRERLQRRMRRARRSQRDKDIRAEVNRETGETEPEGFVAFHDYNPAQGQFDHWSV